MKLQIKIIIIAAIIAVLVTVINGRAFGYTSSPSEVSHCSVSPVNNVSSYSASNVLWYWRCWTVADLHNYVKDSWTTKGGLTYYSKLEKEMWYAGLLGPRSAYAFTYDNNGRAVLNIVASAKWADETVNTLREEILATCGNDCVLVEGADIAEWEIKEIADYTTGMGSETGTCDSADYCAGTPFEVSKQFINGQWESVRGCNAAGGTSCATKRSFCKQTSSVEGAVVWAAGGQVTVHGSLSGAQNPTSAEVAAICAVEHQALISGNATAVADKAVDDAASRSNLAKAMLQDALKGSTIATDVPAGGVDATGGTGSRGLGSTAESALAGAEADMSAFSGTGLPGDPVYDTDITAPEESGISGLLTAFIENTPILSILSSTTMQLTGATCSVSGNVGGFALSLNLCPYQSYLVTMGNFLVAYTTLNGLFVVLGGRRA